MGRRQLMLLTVCGLSSLLFTACDGEQQPTATAPLAASPPTVPATTFSGVLQTIATTASPTTSPATTTSQAPTTTIPSTTPPEAGPLRISIEVNGGVVEGADGHLVVPRGTEIELTVTADVSDEVHVHFYDFKANVTPTDAAVIQFVADVPGIFEVELEDSRLVLLELEVR